MIFEGGWENEKGYARFYSEDRHTYSEGLFKCFQIKFGYWKDINGNAKGRGTEHKWGSIQNMERNYFQLERDTHIDYREGYFSQHGEIKDHKQMDFGVVSDQISKSLIFCTGHDQIDYGGQYDKKRLLLSDKNAIQI